MFKRYNTMWAKAATLVFSVVAMLAIAGSGAFAAGACKKINGKIMLSPATTDNCLSTVGICAGGQLSGDLKGMSSFVGTSLSTTPITPETGVLVLTGDNVIHTAGGTLMTKDSIVLKSSGAGDFGEVDVIVGGTGEWAGASGQFRAQGVFTAAAGGSGDYVGEICMP